MAAERNEPDPRDFVISRVLDAPRDLVWEAWTDPKHVTRWWGPRAFTNPVCEMDVRPGGSLRIVMRDASGVDYPMTGVYREVVRPGRLVVAVDISGHPKETWQDVADAEVRERPNPAGEMVQTVTLEDAGNGRTRLTITTRFESARIRDAMVKVGANEGWSQSLAKLDELLAPATADRAIVTTRLLDAPRELVWEAWTDPDHVKEWWGPKGFTNTIHEMDVRPGGVWRFVMHGPDGTDYRNKIVFVEVVKPARFVYDHLPGPKFKVTTTFEDEGGKTRLTMRAVFDTVAERDQVAEKFGAVEGAEQTLARLAEHLVGMAG